MRKMIKVAMFIAVLVSVDVSLAYRILLVGPIPSGSHAILGDACVKILLNAGHEVVYVTAMPNRVKPHPNFVEVDVSSNAKYFPTNIINITYILNNPSNQPNAVYFLDKASLYSVKTVNHEAVQKVLNDEKKFDLVIAEWMFSEIFAGLPALYDCPLIWLSTMEPHSMILSLIDEAPNPAYNSDFGTNNVVPFTFFERVQQLGLQLLITMTRTYYIYFTETVHFNNLFVPMMEKVGRKLASYNDLRFNASLVLSNSHASLGQPTRLPPNFISIGGYHIEPQPSPLSKNVQDIMDKAKNGVIYFSMGSILNSKDFPQNLKMELLEMFGSLNQTVLWKFEEDFSNLPNNVHVLKWASQQSILNHPNCVLFISHCGLLSLTESIHYGIPVIGVPGFGDQFVNIMRAEQRGFAKRVDLSYNLAKDLKIAIEEMIFNPKYKENIAALSFLYHDRPIHPRKELVHWVEHVIKSRGAPLLKSPALKVPFYQKMYLDLVAVVLVFAFVISRIIKQLIRTFLSANLYKDNRKLDVKKIN